MARYSVKNTFVEPCESPVARFGRRQYRTYAGERSPRYDEDHTLTRLEDRAVCPLSTNILLGRTCSTPVALSSKSNKDRIGSSPQTTGSPSATQESQFFPRQEDDCDSDDSGINRRRGRQAFATFDNFDGPIPPPPLAPPPAAPQSVPESKPSGMQFSLSEAIPAHLHHPAAMYGYPVPVPVPVPVASYLPMGWGFPGMSMPGFAWQGSMMSPGMAQAQFAMPFQNAVDPCQAPLQAPPPFSPKATVTLQPQGPAAEPSPSVLPLSPADEEEVAPRSHRRLRLWAHIYLHMQYPNFDLVPRLIGRGGCNMRRIATQTGAKVRIRGRGSGHLEINGQTEAPTPLMVAVTTDHEDAAAFKQAVEMTLEELKLVEDRFRSFCRQNNVTHDGPCYSLSLLPEISQRALGEELLRSIPQATSRA